MSTVASATAPGLKKRASSFGPGGPLGDQLPAVDQRVCPPTADQEWVPARAGERRRARTRGMRENFRIRYSGVRIGLIITAAIDRLRGSNGARSVALKPVQSTATLGKSRVPAVNLVSRAS